MGNDDSGLAFSKFCQGIANALLGALIQCGRSFIHHQDRSRSQKGPCDGDPLLLATGELSAFGADKCIATLPDQICNGGLFRSLPDCFIGGVRANVTDVFPDGIIEDDNILGHHGKRLTQGSDFEIFNGLIADRNLSAINIVEPGNEAQDSCFARPCRAHDSCSLATLEGHADAVKKGRLL